MARGDTTYVKGSIAAAAVVNIIPSSNTKQQIVSFRTTTGNTSGNTGEADLRLYMFDGTTLGYISPGDTAEYKGEIAISSDYFRIHNNGATTATYYLCIQEV